MHWRKLAFLYVFTFFCHKGTGGDASKRFTNRRTYIKHCVEAHGRAPPRKNRVYAAGAKPRDALCEDCGASFASVRDLRRHSRQLHGKREHQVSSGSSKPDLAGSTIPGPEILLSRDPGPN